MDRTHRRLAPLDGRCRRGSRIGSRPDNSPNIHKQVTWHGIIHEVVRLISPRWVFQWVRPLCHLTGTQYRQGNRFGSLAARCGPGGLLFRHRNDFSINSAWSSGVMPHHRHCGLEPAPEGGSLMDYVEICADEDSVSHFRDRNIAFSTGKVAPPMLPLGVSSFQPATEVGFARQVTSS